MGPPLPVPLLGEFCSIGFHLWPYPSRDGVFIAGLQDEAPGAGYTASVAIFLQVFDFNCPFWLHQKRLGVRNACYVPGLFIYINNLGFIALIFSETSSWLL